MAQDARFILITQCLQNDFFLNTGCRLCLPESETRRLLLGAECKDRIEDCGTGWLTLPDGYPRKGPLGRFLERAIGSRIKNDDLPILHVVNIRDWHTSGTDYDRERERYGAHCAADSHGAAFVDGLKQYLAPKPPNGQTRKYNYVARGSARFYDIQSDSVFDFGRGGDSGTVSELLRWLINGTDADVESLHGALQESTSLPPVRMTTEERRQEREAAKKEDIRVYVAVIGVYTDIKVKTLLVGMRTRFDIDNLALSESLTASPSTERHLAALDFASRVLWVDIIHGLNDLLRFLGTPDEIVIDDELTLIGRRKYADYASFFQDKQNVLAFGDERLQDYLRLTARRAESTYNAVKLANWSLLGFGCLFLLAACVSSFLSMWDPNRFKPTTAAVFGGFGLAQLLASFFAAPTRALTRNLTNLVCLRTGLEVHSLKTALARHHLTSVDMLVLERANIANPEKITLLERQLALLERQLAILDTISRAGREAFDPSPDDTRRAPAVPDVAPPAVAPAPTGNHAPAPGP